jgi:hypothetical protein
MIPHPIKALEMTCGTHEMFGLEVHANQNRPAGRRMEPAIMGGSLSSGMIFPFLMRLRLKVVLVTVIMVITPQKIPIAMPRKGSAPTPAFQPRFSWKEIGYWKKLVYRKTYFLKGRRSRVRARRRETCSAKKKA